MQVMPMSRMTELTKTAMTTTTTLDIAENKLQPNSVQHDVLALLKRHSLGGVTSHWRFFWRSDVVFCLPKIYKKLSYRKQIARQLRTQYVEGIYSNSVTMKSWLRVT